MRNYEIMYIVNASIDEEARKAEIEKLHNILKSNKVEIRDVKEWGLRDFAYPIKSQNKGYYVILKVTGNYKDLNEFSRLVRLNGNVLRHLVTDDQD